MSAPSKLAEVAQDYSEFHVSVEAHNPGKRETQRTLGARVIRRVSSSVDFRRFASLGRAEDDETPAQKKGKNESDRPEVKEGAAMSDNGHLKSEIGHQRSEANQENGKEKSVASERVGDRKLGASPGCQRRDQCSAISAQGFRRKLSQRIGFKQSSSGINAVSNVNASTQERLHAEEPKTPVCSTTDGQEKTISKPNPKSVASGAGSLMKRLSKSVNLKGFQKTQVVPPEGMPMDSSPVSESSDRARKDSNRDQITSSKSTKAEPCPREKSTAFHGSRLLRKVSSTIGIKQNR